MKRKRWVWTILIGLLISGASAIWFSGSLGRLPIPAPLKALVSSDRFVPARLASGHAPGRLQRVADMKLPKTAEWIQTTTHSERRHTSTLRWWLRLDPPALAWQSDLGNHDVIDERGHLHTNTSWKDCRLYPHGSDWNPDDLLSHVLPTGRSAPPAGDSARVTPGGWTVDRVVFEGRQAARYRKRYPEGDFEVDMTRWLDPATGLLLRSERKEFNGRTGRLVMETLQHGHQYDVESPDGVFELPPPAKPLVVERDAGFPDVTGTLPPEDRNRIERAIAQSNEGWRSGDFAAFSRAWYFPVLRLFSARPSKSDWRRRARENAGLWKRWDASIVSIDRTDHVVVAVGSSTFRMETAPGTLRVATTLYVEWGDPRKSWKGKATYYVQKRSDGYRIVHWEYPSAELQALR